MSRRKKNTFVAILILAMAICGLMTACGDDEESTVQQTTEPTKKIVTAKEASEKNGSGAAQDAATQDESAQTDQNHENGDASNDGSGQDHDGTNDVQATTVAPTASTASDSGKSNSSGKSKTNNNKPAPKPKYCYVSVDDYCDGAQIKISSGDSAYTVLKKTGAVVSARKTQYGIYVEGINGLFEFDKGDTSGWMYSVNGVNPNKSCDKYKIKKGDQVVWYYVTEQ